MLGSRRSRGRGLGEGLEQEFPRQLQSLVQALECGCGLFAPRSGLRLHEGSLHPLEMPWSIGSMSPMRQLPSDASLTWPSSRDGKEEAVSGSGLLRCTVWFSWSSGCGLQQEVAVLAGQVLEWRKRKPRVAEKMPKMG